ncbi:hypothetical protein Rt10032_c01g0579 [Rhodotorula toruloides]|uniref:Uncharacterized protein n=1 Tax=Rhodotorula toruloides TaxID=5286 RepID=A0A511K895_RHOTO|nr:hypothetical protein Rt10032_c01g0579 [Rhodotorula toruloides]
MPSKTRTPESTPPPSLSKSGPGPQAPTLDVPVGTNNIATPSPTQNPVEEIKKRHLRSVSQPVNVLSKSPGTFLPAPKRGDCTVM